MIDYEKNMELKKEIEDELIQRVSELEDDLMDILMNFMSGKVDMDQTHRQLLIKITTLEMYLTEHFDVGDFTEIKNVSKSNYRRYDKNKEYRKKLKEYKERIEEYMRKNNEKIDVPSVPSDYIETPTVTYADRLNEHLAKMGRLVQQGYEIKWSDNEHYCTINGKVFNVPKQVWNVRKHEVL